MNNNGRVVEEHRRDTSRVLLESVIATSHEHFGMLAQL